MKNTWIISLAAAFLIGCILVAGCVSPSEPAKSAGDPVQTITFEKNGTTYNIGESFMVTLPSNPSTGYDWYASETGGLNITKMYLAPLSSIPGAGGHTIFTITSVKEGTYEYTFEYKRAWENETEPLYVYKGVRNCAASDAAALTIPRGYVSIAGSVNPAIGEIVKITTPANPTTGYTWSANDDSGLTILSAEYIAPAATAPEGAGGQYVWLVTAEKPGSYIFTGVEQHSGDEEPLTVCNIGLTFIDREASHASGVA